MAAQPKDRTVYPKGADEKLLKRLLERSFAEREKRFQEEHEAFLRESELKAKGLAPLADALGPRRDEIEKATAGQRKAMRERLFKERPPPFKPVKGHNPVRYPPLDFQWSSINCGGITVCGLYGPNANSGFIGARLGIFNGGGASAASAVGFWVWSQQAGTMYVTMQASVWGRGYVFSALFGYASAYAGLRAFIREHSERSPTFSATTTIYDDWGVVEFDIRTFDWVTRNVSIAVPVRPYTWYEVWTEAVQSAYAGGIADSVSNFAMYAGPVWWFIV